MAPLQLKGILVFALTLSGLSLMAQPKGYNYDESLVPQYTLPDPLVMKDGTRVKSKAQWRKRRTEILNLFRSEVYGKQPRTGSYVRSEVLSEEPALNGKAIRKQVRLYLDRDLDRPAIDVLIYMPAKGKGPLPAFLGINFYGNHTIQDDPGIVLSDRWMRNSKDKGTKDNQATEASRGVSSSRWPVEMIIERGYALATIYYGDIDPDFHDGFENGVHGVFDRRRGDDRPADAWGSIAAWAWGCSRVMDYFEKDRAIDAKRVAMFGHSRLGKTSLWTGAEDERFALIISNDSGCGGAALSRRAFGETVKRINTSFPHWFCGNFKKYNDNEAALPVDQHMLISLIAPRPVYVASARQDQWADPKGEFLSAKHAGPVYAIYGKGGVGVEEQPDVNSPVGDVIRYHMRTGKHDVTDYDWEQYLKAADDLMR